VQTGCRLFSKKKIKEKSAARMNERKQQIESEQNEIQKQFGFL